MVHRIDTPTAVANVNGPGRTGFIKGNASTSTPATRVSPAWFNDMQESVCRVVERFLGALEKGNGEQMADAIDARIDEKIGEIALPSLEGYLRADTAATLTAGYFTAPVVVAIAGGHAVLDVAEGNVFTIAVTADFTLDFPAGMAGKAGMMLVVATQDGTGRTLTLASGLTLAAGEWSITPGAVNLLWITSDGSGTVLDVVISQRGA